MGERLKISKRYYDISRNRYYIKITDSSGKETKLYYARYLMEQKLGRKLESNEVVHHIDGNQLNDTVENLKVMGSSKHHSLHAKNPKVTCYSRKNPKHLSVICIVCGKAHLKYKSQIKSRIICCSYKCMAIARSLKFKHNKQLISEVV